LDSVLRRVDPGRRGDAGVRLTPSIGAFDRIEQAALPEDPRQLCNRSLYVLVGRKGVSEFPGAECGDGSQLGRGEPSDLSYRSSDLDDEWHVEVLPGVS
jgi:hypothetical protein